MGNPSQDGYYNIINPLVEGVPPHNHRPPPGGPHIFTGLKYSGASTRCRPYFTVVQFIGLKYSVSPVGRFFLNVMDIMHLHSSRTRAQLEPASVAIEAFIVKEHPHSTQALSHLSVLLGGEGGSWTMEAAIFIEAISSCDVDL